MRKGEGREAHTFSLMEAAYSLLAEDTSTMIINDSKKINSLPLRIGALPVIAVSCLQITGNTRSRFLQAHAQVIVTAIGCSLFLPRVFLPSTCLCSDKTGFQLSPFLFFC